MGPHNPSRIDLKTLGIILGVLFTVAAASFALSFYCFQAMFDSNLAYMAIYYDDMTANLHAQNASPDATAVAASQAVNFCYMLTTEKRELDWMRYWKLCDNISQSANFAGAEMWDEFEAFQQQFKTEKASYRDLYPSVSFVFSSSFKRTKCLFAGDVEEVPCPWDKTEP